MIQFVQPVVTQKIFQRGRKQRPIRLRPIRTRQRPLHQHRRAIAHIARDHVPSQLRPPKMPQHRVHRMDQIQPRIDQCPIQIEHQQPNRPSIEFPQKSNHENQQNRGIDRINDARQLRGQRLEANNLACSRLAARSS